MPLDDALPTPRPHGTADRITSDAQAIATARRLAAEFAVDAARRDRDRGLPFQEIERFSASGLWAISVPREYGGAGVSHATLAEVIAIVSEADPSIGQIPQNHFYMVEAIRLDGTDAQKSRLFAQVLGGMRIGNAFSEIGTRTHIDFKTRVTRRDDGSSVLNGRKFYSTGVLFAHTLAVVARADDDRTTIVLVDRAAPGVRIVDDWSSFGQRTTGSGTTEFAEIVVDNAALIDHQAAFDRPTTMGPVAQLLHAAVDLGIARAALAETVAFVRHKSRPWIDSGQDHATQDPYTIAAVGDVRVRIRAAEATLRRAGHVIDRVAAAPDADGVSGASCAVAAAKVLTTEAALLATNKLFELAGTRSTLAAEGLDRHWRNARAHTLHDPARWKLHAVGNWTLNGTHPPRHGAL